MLNEWNGDHMSTLNETTAEQGGAGVGAQPTSSQCLWCDDPTVGGDQLCPSCRAINDGPTVWCERHETHTMGTECVMCVGDDERRRRSAEANAPALASLRAIRASLVAEFYRPRWPGCEFGKTIIGRSIDAAIAELEGRDPAPITSPAPKVRRKRVPATLPAPTPKLNRRQVESRAERLALGVDVG
jgi:hypothetical protein